MIKLSPKVKAALIKIDFVKRYEELVSDKTNNFSKIMDFIKELQTNVTEEKISFYFNLLKDERNVRLFLTLRAFFDKYGKQGESFLLNFLSKNDTADTKLISEAIMILSSHNYQCKAVLPYIYKYLTNVNQRGQAKIVTALELYMFYLQKIVNFSSVSFKNIPSKEKNKKSANLYNVPIVGKIAAGQPILAEEYVEGYLPVDPNIYGLTTSNDLFYLLVSGDSMDKKVENGDYVLIHKQDYANDGDIIVAIVNDDDEATLKRYKVINEQFVQLEPMSNNPIHQTRTIDLKTTKFMIIGKAIGKFGKF